MKIHQLKIDFNVTENIKRFVYVYIIEAGHCYLVDSGVFGCEKQIIGYLESIGRKPSDIKGLFLTHSHPDHIGTAAWWQENTDCKIYASESEKRWIEDIDLQFTERPIPNFYRLAGRSSRVDVILKNGDTVELEPALQVKTIGTAGHSAGHLSYLVNDALFIGDAVPVKGDIPIFIDEAATRNTLKTIEQIPNVKTYYPAWDKTYDYEMMKTKLLEAEELTDHLKAAVIRCDKGDDTAGLVKSVCDYLKMPMLKQNPLFAMTIACLGEGAKV
ncbi:MAG: MBL fold metallo-hydrolase [Clostridia bacterium]|nr:MBL fold metallo-hydrolase [Clostridia bacterium]